MCLICITCRWQVKFAVLVRFLSFSYHCDIMIQFRCSLYVAVMSWHSRASIVDLVASQYAYVHIFVCRCRVVGSSSVLFLVCLAVASPVMLYGDYVRSSSNFVSHPALCVSCKCLRCLFHPLMLQCLLLVLSLAL